MSFGKIEKTMPNGTSKVMFWGPRSDMGFPRATYALIYVLLVRYQKMMILDALPLVAKLETSVHFLFLDVVAVNETLLLASGVPGRRLREKRQVKKRKGYKDHATRKKGDGGSRKDGRRDRWTQKP